MFIITKVEDKIRSLPERYKAQQSVNGQWHRKEYEANYNVLKKICPVATAKEIKDLMGTDNWIRLVCDMCRQSVPVIAAFYLNDQSNVIVCETCLDSALKQLRKRK